MDEIKNRGSNYLSLPLHLIGSRGSTMTTKSDGNHELKQVNNDNNHSRIGLTEDVGTKTQRKSELQHVEDCIERYTKKNMVTIHPTMLGITAPFTVATILDSTHIQFNFTDCNHNTPNSAKGNDIMNNLLDNLMEREMNHEQSLQNDGKLFVIK